MKMEVTEDSSTPFIPIQQQEPQQQQQQNECNSSIANNNDVNEPEAITIDTIDSDTKLNRNLFAHVRYYLINSDVPEV